MNAMKDGNRYDPDLPVAIRVQTTADELIVSITDVAPGEVVLINATLPGLPGGVPVSTGVRIIYADDVSFTVMTPAGHPEAGFNTFSAFEEEGETVAQVQSLGRANDPIYEMGYRLMGGASNKRPSGATC